MNSMDRKKLKESFVKSCKSMYKALPVLVGAILLISLANNIIPKDIYSKLFRNSLFDPIIGSIIGSILAGNPITSYVLGGEFFAAGIGIMAISAFIVTWVTVGIVQLPAEILLLGKKFALLRNLFSFLSAIVIGVCTYFILL